MKEKSRLIKFLKTEFKKVSLVSEENLDEFFRLWFNELDKEQILMFTEMAIQYYVNKATEGLYEN